MMVGSQNAWFIVMVLAIFNHCLLVAARIANPSPSIGCILTKCGGPGLHCMADKQCRSALECDAKCQHATDVNGCNLICELTAGYNSSLYHNVLQCAVDNGCFPQNPPDGSCLANDTDAVANLTDMSQVSGKWWILKGLNCGQSGWPGAFDWFPCQRDEFVFEDGKWVDHISYCGGKNNTCTTPIVNTVADAKITSPGVMTHWYTDPPLKPQIEEWRVLSWPHPDFMLYIYCGHTPLGPYAGGSVVSRTVKTMSGVPSDALRQMEAVASRFGFDIDDMCESDVRSCPN